jgi:Nitrile hydratase, alpha chain
MDEINTYEILQERILKDENFRNKFVDDPKPVLAKVGVIIPDSVKVEVHVNNASTINLVLPLPQNDKEVLNSSLLRTRINHAFSAVIQRAWSNEIFKAQLMRNPKKVIKEAIGKEIPSSIDVHVYEDSPTVKHLVLQLSHDVDIFSSDELSEEELKMVAGGLQLKTSGITF